MAPRFTSSVFLWSRPRRRCLLKGGVITVSPEDVHNHSAKIKRSVGGRTFRPASPASWRVAAAGTVWSREASFQKTVLLTPDDPWPLSPRWPGRPETGLSVLPEPQGSVGGGGLPDSVIVWSGVLWRQRRVIASGPGGKRSQNQQKSVFLFKDPLRSSSHLLH